MQTVANQATEIRADCSQEEMDLYPSSPVQAAQMTVFALMCIALGCKLDLERQLGMLAAIRSESDGQDLNRASGRAICRLRHYPHFQPSDQERPVPGI